MIGHCVRHNACDRPATVDRIRIGRLAPGAVDALPLHLIADSRRRARALAAWTDWQTLRTVGRSIADGIGQDAIARALGISQPAVSKLARRARAAGDLDSRSPREVILERAIGMIDTTAMLGELRAWTYTLERFDDDTALEPESYVPELRGQLEDAAVGGCCRVRSSSR